MSSMFIMDVKDIPYCKKCNGVMMFILDPDDEEHMIKRCFKCDPPDMGAS